MPKPNDIQAKIIPSSEDPEKQQIYVDVSGGLVSDVTGVPEGYEVVIRDYDCDTADADDELVKDGEDDPYHECIYDSRN